MFVTADATMLFVFFFFNLKDFTTYGRRLVEAEPLHYCQRVNLPIQMTKKKWNLMIHRKKPLEQ